MSRSATLCTTRSARVLSLPMAGPAAVPVGALVAPVEALVDLDAEALEEALEELRMDMAQLLLLLVVRSQGKNATT